MVGPFAHHALRSKTTQPAQGKYANGHVDAPIRTPSDGGVLERYRARTAARRGARLIRPRKIRMIARWLRRTAVHTQPPHPLARSRETLLHDRVKAVRTELLQIAAMLERAREPDPATVTILRSLLADGCDSPLYSENFHTSELRASLYYVRRGLATAATEDAPV